MVSCLDIPFRDGENVSEDLGREARGNAGEVNGELNPTLVLQSGIIVQYL